MDSTQLASGGHPLMTIRLREFQLVVASVILITLAELVTAYIEPGVGLLIHFAIMVILVGVATLRYAADPFSTVLLSLFLAPLIRVVSLSMPFTDLPQYSWYILPSVPLVAATVLLMRRQNIGWADIGITLKAPLLQTCIALTGIPLGVVEYVILRPDSLVDPSFSFVQLVLLVLAFIVTTGYVEEFVFRGVIQRSLVRAFGATTGVLCVAVLFMVLHVGWNSLPDLAFVFAVGLLFGVLAHKTRSIIGVAVSHGLINVLLFLVLPTTMLL